jgi:hypothetical protein
MRILGSGSAPNEGDCFHCAGRGRESEADFAAIRRKREHQLLNRMDEFLNPAIVVLESALKFGELGNNLLVRVDRFAHADERADNENAHLNCSL